MVANWIRYSLGLIVSLISLTGVAGAQYLVADKPDYLPGETVYFAGCDFAPGEDVGLTLRVESEDESVTDYVIGGVTADGFGDFAATWLVPVEALNTSITAVAVGMSSGKVARTLFYDGVWTTPYDVSVTSSGEYITATVSIHYARSRAGMPNNSAWYALGDNSESIRVGFRNQADNPFQKHLPRISYVSDQDRTYQATWHMGCDRSARIESIEAPIGRWGWYHGKRRWYLYWDETSYSNGPSASTSSCEPCLVNAPPVLEVTDLDLGFLVGCLTSTGFEKSVTVAASDFSYQVMDPDNDPVTVTFNGPATFNFVGPGAFEGTVSFTATDDPSGRQGQSSCELYPESTTVEATVRGSIVYDVEGPLAPLTSGTVLPKKRGRTIPIKFRLLDCNGAEVCPLTLASLEDDANKPTIDAIVTSALSPDGDAPVEDPGNSMNEDLIFRYTGDCGVDGHWQYELSTKGPGWTADLLYTATIHLDDGTEFVVDFSLKK